MGVWIETISRIVTSEKRKVTPCMGVWIETAAAAAALPDIVGHTLYGCVD